MIIISQRNLVVNRKDKNMKVKVKKIPAPVREQGEENTFAWVAQKFGECFKNYCANRNHLVKPQSLKNHYDCKNAKS